MAKLKDIIRGDSLVISLNCANPDGTPFNLTGYSLYFTAKPVTANLNSDDSVAAIQKTVVSVPNPTSGVGVIELTPIDMNVAPGKYYYDIQFKDSSGRVNSLKADELTIIADVTRRS